MQPARAGGSACPYRATPRQHPNCGCLWNVSGEKLWTTLGGGACFEVLVTRAVVAVRERRPLARLALAGRRAAAGDAAVERAGLDLLLDELDRRIDPLRHGPRDLRLAGDREVAADVLEERPVGLREIERVGREPLHRRLARGEDCAA